MRVLIDIGHPGHVHLFKSFADIIIKKGHDVFFTCRKKEFEIELLSSLGFNYICFGNHYKTLKGKLFGLVKYDFKMLLTAIRYKPDVFLSHGSIYASHIAWLLRKPHIALEDSGNMEQIRLYLPFSKVILTPDVLEEEFGEKQIKYSGYHELAYLHPKYFTPDKRVVFSLGIDPDTPYCILRFVSWNATHDKNIHGFSILQKNEIVQNLLKKFRVYISSEGELPEELIQYKLNIPPEKIHHVLAFAEICISEGATIASESGLLGTPTIYMNPLKRFYNEDQEKYGTLFNFRSPEGVLEKATEIINDPQRKSIVSKKRDKMIKEKIDVTSFLVWFVVNWPESFSIMKREPDYQLKFKNI